MLIGYLGADPDCRETKSGKRVAELSIATNSSYKDKKGDKVKTTQWHKLVAWGPAADYAERFLHKGSFLGVLGRINYRQFTDGEGKERYFTEVVVEEFKNLDRAGTEGALPF
jgi:single-strand DNA-binding protein